MSRAQGQAVVYQSDLSQAQKAKQRKDVRLTFWYGYLAEGGIRF